MKKGTRLINKANGIIYTVTGNKKEMYNGKRTWEVIEIVTDKNEVQYISENDVNIEILKNEEDTEIGKLINELKGIQGILACGNSKCEDIIVVKGICQFNINYTNGIFTTIIKDLTDGYTDYAGKKKHKTYKGLAKFIKAM